MCEKETSVTLPPTFDVPKFIKLVEKYPAIWDANHIDFKDKPARGASWDAIANQIFREWEKLDQAEREGAVKALVKKWKILRGMHSKHRKLTTEFGKKRSFVYEKLLEFLSTDKGDYDDVIFSQDIKEEKLNIVEYIEINDDFDDNIRPSGKENDENDSVSSGPSSSKVTSTETVNEDEEKTLNEKEKRRYSHKRKFDEESEGVEEEDSDKMFILSMLPLFKKLDEEKKVIARIHLTQVLQKLLFPKK